MHRRRLVLSWSRRSQGSQCSMVSPTCPVAGRDQRYRHRRRSVPSLTSSSGAVCLVAGASAWLSGSHV